MRQLTWVERREMLEKKDPHRWAASRMFGVSEDQVTENQRAESKLTNFAALYGSRSEILTLKQWEESQGEKLEAWRKTYGRHRLWETIRLNLFFALGAVTYAVLHWWFTS